MKVTIKSVLVCGNCGREHTDLSKAETCCLSVRAIRKEIDVKELKAKAGLYTRAFYANAIKTLGRADEDVRALALHAKGLDGATTKIVGRIKAGDNL